MCSDNATCTNTDGFYECECLDGFTGDGYDCSGTVSNVCHKMLEVAVVRIEYKHSLNSILFIDVDECINSSNVCDENAACINTIGSYWCDCIFGFTGDGCNCSGINGVLTSKCNYSFIYHTICMLLATNSALVKRKMAFNNYRCKAKLICITFFLLADVDECNASTHTCSDNATCRNTFGSFECECFEGFIGNGFNCSGMVHMHFIFKFLGVYILFLTTTTIANA